MESVIFTSPFLLILYGIALGLCLFELFTKTTGYVLPLLSCAIVIGTSIYAIILGANLLEVCIVFVVFILLNLAGMRRKKT